MSEDAARTMSKTASAMGFALFGAAQATGQWGWVMLGLALGILGVRLTEEV